MKGSLQIAHDSSVTTATYGRPVKENAVSTSNYLLPNKPYLIEVSNTLSRGKYRTFYISVSSAEMQQKIISTLSRKIEDLKRDHLSQTQSGSNTRESIKHGICFCIEWNWLVLDFSSLLPAYPPSHASTAIFLMPILQCRDGVRCGEKGRIASWRFCL